MNTHLLNTEAKRSHSGLMYYSTQAGKFCCILSFMLISLAAYSQDRPFITIWKTDNEGETEDNQVKFTGHGTEYTIAWEKTDDPNINGSETATDTHIITFPEAGTYRLSVSGGFHRISFPDTAQPSDAKKLTDIAQWGDVEWSSMEAAFQGCENMISTAEDSPDLSNVTNMNRMFRIARIFNRPIEDWDVSKVTDMSLMFSGAHSFNHPIGNWDVSNVTNMFGMFRSAGAFNQPLGNWDVSNVTSMESMFRSAGAFNQPIDEWNVANVTNMFGMFRSAKVFNQVIGNWDVSKVTNMSEMFEDARSFNQPLGNWDVFNVTNMSYMFSFTDSFNQPLGDWDVSNVTDMRQMFGGAYAFNQPIGNWDISKVTNMFLMLSQSKLSSLNYDLSLQGWLNNANTPHNITLDTDGLRYCLSAAERQTLREEYGWTIRGDQPGCDKGAFITLWQTDMEGTENELEINIPFYAEDITVLWKKYGSEDEFEVMNISGYVKPEVVEPGLYQVNILTNNDALMSSSLDNEMLKLTEIKQWGDINWLSLNRAFTNAQNLQLTATDAPDLSRALDLEGMFQDAKLLNTDINHWDVSNVKVMDRMFAGAESFNQSLSSWNTSSVESMQFMFWDAKSFNAEINNWDVSQVKDMWGMFFGAESFDRSLGKWNIAGVEDMTQFFDGTNLSVANYDSTLTTWAASATTPSNIILGAEGLFFCEALADRQHLTESLAWQIVGDKRCFNLVSFFPEEGATRVDKNTEISINFDQNIQALNLGKVSLEDFEGQSVSLAEVSIDGFSLIIKPQSDLDLHAYRVIVPSASVESEWGVANDSILWSFSTQEILSAEKEQKQKYHYNVPNPFSEQTQLIFSLSSPKEVVLMVTDLQGREVTRTALGILDAGEQSHTFPSTGLPSGLYTYHIITAEEKLSGKMMVKK